MNYPNLRRLITLSAILSAAAALMPAAWAEDEVMEEVVVIGDLNSLPGEDVKSIFGFNKSILETPRSVSTVSEELMDRMNMQDIDELVTVSPGSFTQSFFGVAGGLDVRGTPGETYFRGVRRLDNPGNYPTPIGASDRVDIVRGPASPIYGPSKIGGYLNFNPKSARIEETGSYIEENTGGLSYTTGSWNKSVLTAEIGGPAELAGKPMGFYLYGELENSDSFYANAPGVEQTLVQASFDMDLNDRVQLQFGGMYHDYSGAQNAGWNRITQDLIDNGTYITGSPSALDTDGDGKISHQEYDVTGDGFTDFNPFGAFAFATGGLTLNSPTTFADLETALGDLSAFALNNVGTAQLGMDRTLIGAEDKLENDVTTLYFDIIADLDSGWELKNQLFYESYENINENAYGFSQFHDTYVIEDKLVLSKTYTFDGLIASVQLSPSIRYTDFEHGDDYTNEYFARRDLTGPSTALDARLLATAIDDDYTEYYIGEYTDIGIAFLTDLSWENGLSLLLGARHDRIDMESRQPVDKLLLASSNNFTTDPASADIAVSADNDVSGNSWTVSVSYDIANSGIIPYITVSEQATVIAGQGAELTVSNVASGGAFDSSDLLEFGVKGELLEDGRLYFSLAHYEQERTDFSAQSIVTNQAVKTEGTEFELRWAVNDALFVGATYTNVEAKNLASIADGNRFSFFGAEDLPNVPSHLLFGGQIAGPINVAASGGRRAGMPENIYSAYGTYLFDNGLTISASVTDVDSAPSGFSNSIVLPGYTLLNMTVGWESDSWNFSLTGKNLTDERYFRSNFPNLFGSTIVLPELPRHFIARAQYSF
jgi:iron complex outermembrane receptor protein